MIEIHSFMPGRGHLLSTDCWCEPAQITVSKMNDGVTPCLIVEHEPGATPVHHLDVVRERYAAPDWITRVLNDPTTKQLPPHEGD
jgi:hypothetical protein